jgi:SAM-dependent methyltransferase
MPDTVDLYDNVYGDYASAAEAAVRTRAFGEDIGQSSWITAADWLGYADRLGVTADSRVLEVGSGSGGPAVYLAANRGCRITGVDINASGISNARRLAEARGVADRVTFEIIDAGKPLPFAPGTFDSVVSNDAMCHIADRLAVLREWRRVLRPRGRMLFTDAMIVTGLVSDEEVATRTSIGFYLLVPPGENERLIATAGFTLISAEDVTEGAAVIARRWREARDSHRAELHAREGADNFDGLQRFLGCVQTLSEQRRMSRFCYLAERSAE